MTVCAGRGTSYLELIDADDEVTGETGRGSKEATYALNLPSGVMTGTRGRGLERNSCLIVGRKILGVCLTARKKGLRWHSKSAHEMST